MPRSTVRSAAMAVAVVLSAAASVTVAAVADADRSQVRFVATQSDVPLDGSFKRFSVDVDFDPARPQAGRIKVAIELASVDAGGSDANDLLKNRDFFDVGRFPGAAFESTSIQATGNGAFKATGRFTLKGHSADLAFPFAARPDGTGTWFEGSFPISRLAYRVGEGEWSDVSTLADEVQIKFKVHVPR